MISFFKDEFHFLSNFDTTPFVYKNELVKSAEHAFQAEKATNDEARRMILDAVHPGQAKKLGRTVVLPYNWDEYKVSHMRDVLKSKFSVEVLRDKLLATGNEELEEGNYWHDNFWGICRCAKCSGIGENMLGRLLIELRNDLQLPKMIQRKKKSTLRTSYYSKSHLHPNAVSIAAKCPEFYKGREYKKLAPKWWFFKKYKDDGDETFYIEQYKKEVLEVLDPATVLKEIGQDAVLLCWEAPGKFCHRHLVATWFKETLGLEVSEII